METLASLVFNYSNKVLIPSLLSEPFRGYVYCNNMNFFFNKKVTVNETVLHAINLSKRLVKTSCSYLNGHYILHVFNNSYRSKKDDYNPNLTIKEPTKSDE